MEAAAAAGEESHVWNRTEDAARGVSCRSERPCDTRGWDDTISLTLPTLLFGWGWFLYFVVSASGVAAIRWSCKDAGEDRNV